VIPVHVLGARGLLAGEFLRLIASHPELELGGAYVRGTPASPCLGSVHPHLPPELAARELAPVEDLVPQLLAQFEDDDRGAILLLALPHGASAPWWSEHRDELTPLMPALRVVDLSADFRLQGAASYEAAYDAPHACPDELGAWTYGLPELHPVQTGDVRIAAPGCFATALQIATLPFVRAGMLDGQRPWIVSGVTGSSGSGAVPRAGTHHPHRAVDFHAYSLAGHRHEAELLAPRNFPDQAAPVVDFTPHSAPMGRGIHLHGVLPLAAPAEGRADPGQVLDSFCEPLAFVQAVPHAPHVRHVAGSNRMQLHAYERAGSLHVLAALDNTLKGGAGQALQCINLSLGWPETTGLPTAALGY